MSENAMLEEIQAKAVVITAAMEVVIVKTPTVYPTVQDVTICANSLATGCYPITDVIPWQKFPMVDDFGLVQRQEAKGSTKDEIIIHSAATDSVTSCVD